MKKVLTVLLAFAVVMCAGAAFAASVLDKDVILVGTESTFKPFEFRNANNEIVGFDIDMINKVAEKLGKKVEVVDMAFDALIPSLLTGRIDIIAAGMSATKERAKKVFFSSVYYNSPAAVVTKADAPYTSLDQLKGKVASVQMGTIQDNYLTTHTKDIEIKRYQKTDDGLREVLLGRADFAMYDFLTAKKYVTEAKDFKGKLKIAFPQVIGTSGTALALSKKDPKFLEAVNNALAEMKAEGFMDDLFTKWVND